MVYLLHFWGRVHHAQHYLGYTENLYERFRQHLDGKGSPLVKAAIGQGLEVDIACTWQGDRRLERRLKNRHNSRKLCPICKSDV